jgi:hypothetical protein
MMKEAEADFRNPMLTRAEIRDVHGVRTESTYVVLILPPLPIFSSF